MFEQSFFFQSILTCPGVITIVIICQTEEKPFISRDFIHESFQDFCRSLKIIKDPPLDYLIVVLQIAQTVTALKIDSV